MHKMKVDAHGKGVYTHKDHFNAQAPLYTLLPGENMMLGVKLFIDLFIGCPGLLVAVSCLGLCLSVCPLERALRGERERQP